MMELGEFLMLSMEMKKNLVTLSLSASDKSMMELSMVIKVKEILLSVLLIIQLGVKIL